MPLRYIVKVLVIDHDPPNWLKVPESQFRPNVIKSKMSKFDTIVEKPLNPIVSKFNDTILDPTKEKTYSYLKAEILALANIMTTIDIKRSSGLSQWVTKSLQSRTKQERASGKLTHSPVFYINDRNSKMSFMIEIGAELGSITPSSAERVHSGLHFALQAVN
ncbi:unnamed protein product [Hymenolepis diminuta]|uniref:PRELI/MSF1 domain-containing protein n=1 Tax=Hymenolepis diminuta TaxID=6216 RepID=A0A0R3SZN0_HYMDI|nr:unnamed protein product [Hymenolepis diminuta]